MANREELLRVFESALNEIPAEEIAEVDANEVARAPSGRRATYMVGDGTVTIRRSGRERCIAARLLDVAGSSVTGGDGTIQIRLNRFHCLDRPPEAGTNTLAYETPVNVVATASSATPSFVTVQTQVITGTPDDLSINFFSWDAGGNPLAGVRVNWRCIVPLSQNIG